MARPCKLTSEVQERIVAAVRAGSYRQIAATLAGISERTLYDWIAKGEKDKRGGGFSQFLQAVKKAEAEWEAEQVAGIRETAEGGQLLSRTTTEKKNGEVVTQETYTRPEWTARAWLLERKGYERWGKRERLEVAGDEKRPLYLTYVNGNKEQGVEAP